MSHLLAVILQFSYIGIFLVIFAESGFLLGFFLPGDSLLFTAGLLASQGIFNIWILVPLVVIAAILGDSFGYFWGKKLGPKVFSREDSLLFHRKHVERTKTFFDEHGKKTIILARFVPVIRTFAPIFAGVGEMPYTTFLYFNVIGGFLWSGLVTLAGFFLGKAFPAAENFLSNIIIAILVLSIYPVIRELLPEKNFMRKVLALDIAAFLAFDLIAAFVHSAPLHTIDQFVASHIIGTAGTFFTSFMEAVSNIMNPSFFSLLLAVFLALFLAKKNYRDFFLVLIATLSGAFVSPLLKILFGIPRPAFSLVTETTFSFPSGHAIMSTVFFGLFFFFARERPLRRGFRHYALSFLAFFLPLLIGFSRIYLGVHWFSDVLAGYCIGVCCLTTAILVMHLLSTRFPHSVFRNRR